MTTFVLEDGTGKSDATSFADEAAASTYWDIHDPAYKIVWDALAAEDSAEALNAGASALDHDYERQMKGGRTTATQALSYPRKNVKRYGFAVLTTVIPDEVVDSNIELARRSQEGTDLEPDLANPTGISAQSVRADTVEVKTSYAGAAPATGSAPLFQKVVDLMAPLLKSSALAFRV